MESSAERSTEFGTEQVGFVRGRRGLLFASHGRPIGRSRGAVLICPSIAADMLRHYRSEVLWSRALTDRGFEVIRFHYHGSGNSDGRAEELSVESMIEDALMVARSFSASSVERSLSIVGTRFGGLIAAGAAARLAAQRLALVEPALEGRTYFRDALRARRAGAAAGGGRSTVDGLAELRERGSIDLLGSTVSLGLYESAEHATVLDELAGWCGAVHLTQMSRGTELRPSTSHALDALRSQGCNVDTLVVTGSFRWWFPEDGDAVKTVDGTEMINWLAPVEAA